MYKNIYIIVSTIVIITLSIISINLYQKVGDAESELMKKELLIFQNHVSSTVRAVEAKDKNLLEDTLVRLQTTETFASLEYDSFDTLTLGTFEDGLKYLVHTNPSKYKDAKAGLDNIFASVSGHYDSELTEEEFKEIIHDVFLQTEKFRDNARSLSEEE